MLMVSSTQTELAADYNFRRGRKLEMIDGRTKNYTRKRVDAIPAVGIRLENFHTFERAPVPSLLNFVVRNVAGLCLSIVTYL